LTQWQTFPLKEDFVIESNIVITTDNNTPFN
jgi:hypothetical protein